MPLVHFFALSEKGLRESNEDSYCTERINGYYVLAVADGLGGHAAGEVASGIAIECLKNAIKICDNDLKSAMKEGVYNADEQILAQGEHFPEKRGMATTLIAACVDDKLNCTVINIGDSRAHIITTYDVKTSKDHSVVNELLDSGEISQDEAWHHPLSTMMSQAIGDLESKVAPDFYEVNLSDVYLLLSSDGLHDFVTKERIKEIILENGNNLEKSCQELVREALENKSDDNITIVLALGEMSK